MPGTIVRLHFLFIAITIVGLALGSYHLSFHTAIQVIVCAGYFISAILSIPDAHRRLRRTQPSVKLVFVLSGIFIIEAITVVFAMIWAFALMFKLNDQTVASGKGYEIRIISSLSWPPRYVLYKANMMLDRFEGDVHANQEDYVLQGNIKAILYSVDSISVTIHSGYKDTTVQFVRLKN